MILNKGNILKESAVETPTQEDIRWLYNWLEPTKEPYLKGWEDGHAYTVFGAKSKLDDDGFNPENDWGIINALIKRGFKYKLTQGDYTYKTVGTFNPNSMQAHNRGFDRTLKNRVRLDIYWKNNENLEEVKNMNKLTEAVDRNKLADFIKKAVEDLKISDAYNEIAPTWFFDMGAPNGLHLVIGYDNADNYDAEDLEHLALDKSGKYVVCAKLAVNVDDMQDDFDWDWYMPYDNETGDAWDTEMAVAKEEDYDVLAQDFINEFDKIKDLDIDEDGAIIEHEEVVEESKKDCDDDCEKESKLVYDALSEYQANHFDDLKDVENDFINSTIDKFAVLAGVFNDVDESCDDKKSLKESVDIDMEALEAYANMEEGENITVTGDLLNVLRQALAMANEHCKMDEGCKKPIKEDWLGDWEKAVSDVKGIIGSHSNIDEENDIATLDSNDVDHIAEEVANLFIGEEPMDEACKKEEKSLTESADQDDIRSAIYDTLRISGIDMQDILCDLVDTALSKAKRGGDVWDACTAAVDEGMTNLADQWKAYQFYCDMGDDKDIMWSNLTEDVFRVTSAILGDDDVEDDQDDEGRDDPMTGDDVWESLDNEVPMNEDELWESLNKLDDQPVADDVLDEAEDKRTVALSQSNK